MFDATKALSVLAAFQDLLDATPDGAAHVRTGPDAWTLAEIVGHLVDSAGNNHQRFVRLRFGDLTQFPAYEAEPWVAAQEYDAFDFPTLAALWANGNQLLLHLARRTPEAAMGHAWLVDGERRTLDSLLNDYYAHLGLHVEHYQRRLGEVRQAMAG